MGHRPTVALVDLDAIRHNVALLKPDRAELMAVVKASGYGHGAVPVARAALDAGATWLGVALVEEGFELREAGLTARILVLTEFPPGSEKEALAAGLTATVYTEEGLHRLAEAAGSHGGPVGAHVKVDTGMHRVGLDLGDAETFVSRLLDLGLELEGLWTHFAKSEALDDPFTALQLDRFRSVVNSLRAGGMVPRILHAANSAAVLARPETHFDLVRVGIAMYGLSPGPALAGRTAALRPAMSWRTAVSMVRRLGKGEGVSYGLTHRLEREATVATIPVGYADGYSRLLSNKAQVLIRGKRCPVVGNVTMDQIMVECGDGPVEPGDEVILIGRQGEEEIAADDLAAWAGTINYEVVCAVSARVPRVYAG